MLRDYIEESIMECFHFVSSIINQDKCRFSERLFTCFADKGREAGDLKKKMIQSYINYLKFYEFLFSYFFQGCEDWND